MSAYREAAERPPPRERDVRTLSISSMGVFGISVWCGFIVFSGVVIGALSRYVGGPSEIPTRVIAEITLGTAVSVGAAIALFQVRARFVARIDDGILQIDARRVESFLADATSAWRAFTSGEGNRSEPQTPGEAASDQ